MAPGTVPRGAVPGGSLALEPLLRQLKDLDQRVQAQRAEDQNFRKANANFTAADTTTQLLLAACEKLAAEKEAMARAHFEEHTSELSYLCKRYNTSIEVGHTDRTYQEHLAAAPAVARVERRTPTVPWFVCCQREFPPQQAWWLESSRRLHPTFQVLRNGSVVNVQARELVPGDIVFLAAGQRCAADARVLVHEDGSLLECSHLSGETIDVRKATPEATSPAITDSTNIVLRDSYLLAGSMFCMVVRAHTNSLIPSGVRELDEDSFQVDTSVPQGMAVSQCRTLFKQLVVKAKLACRSFGLMAKLGRIQVVLVFISEETDRMTAAVLCSSAKRLGRSVFLVVDDGKLESAEALAKEVGGECIDFRTSGSGPDTDGVSTAVHSSSVSLTATEYTSKECTSNANSVACGLNSPISHGMTMPILSRHTPELLSNETRSRLETLSTQVGAKFTCWVLYKPPQEAVATLCQLLSEGGKPVLLALSSVQHAGCMRSLLMNSRYRIQLHRSTSPRVNPSPSVGDARTPRPSVASFSRQASQVSNPWPSSWSHSSPARMVDPVQNSPAFNLRGESNKSYIDLAVAVNSVGIISNFSDAVLFSSDLGCLGKALELAAKVVPPAPPAPVAASI